MVCQKTSTKQVAHQKGTDNKKQTKSEEKNKIWRAKNQHMKCGEKKQG